MDNKTLYRKCVLYGRQALKARRKFLGLLPEVQKRELYARKGFASVYEFAAKLAGVSRQQVDRVLRLEKRYSDKPILHDELITGEVSINKLIRIAPVASLENQMLLVEKAKLLSSRALEVYIKDQNSMPQPSKGGKSAHVPLKLDDDVLDELSRMQEKGIDINKFLRGVLGKRRHAIQEEKETLARQLIHEKEKKDTIGMPTSRNIPMRVQKILKDEFGTKCGRQGCFKTAEHLHHLKPFAEFRIHDPRQIIPLCVGHHELEHASEPKYQKFRFFD